MKIGIVGSGFVGSTAAYAMVMAGIGREIVLVDRNEKRSEAEANDIVHAVPFANPLKIRSGRYEDLKNSRLVIISAGVSQKPGESRLDLLRRNAAVFREVVPGILKHVEEPILIVATNPLDIMTYLAAKYAAEFGLSGARVLGSGTMLDTARFRTLLGEHVGVDPQHVHGYVIGEHGDSEVLAWSTVTSLLSSWTFPLVMNENIEEKQERKKCYFSRNTDVRITKDDRWIALTVCSHRKNAHPF